MFTTRTVRITTPDRYGVGRNRWFRLDRLEVVGYAGETAAAAIELCLLARGSHPPGPAHGAFGPAEARALAAALNEVADAVDPRSAP